LIPALAASSPFQDGKVGSALDGRLVAYRGNSTRIPRMAGLVVPEHVSSPAEYEREILGRLYTELAPHDPEGVLRYEWANARGAIARFTRGSIEIRVIDAQECPTADLAVVAAVVSTVRALAEGRLAERDITRDPSTESLARLLDRAIAQGDEAIADETGVLGVLGVRKDGIRLGEVWARLLDAFPPDDPGAEWTAALQTILDQGPLARRMLAAAGADPDRADLRRVAGALCECLDDNTVFRTRARR
jgi:gamma-glutamyl:cysteine ligase YbdK (ATP-grasp superfamily)